MGMENFIQCTVEPAHWYHKSEKECSKCKAASEKIGNAGLGNNLENEETATVPGNNWTNEDATNKTYVPGNERKKPEPQIIEEDEYEGTGVYRKGVQSGEVFNTKRIVGWLISYDYDPNGLDFKLYEGKNEFGSDPTIKNSIPDDNEISSHHFTILFRKNEFTFSDEKSTNGSYLNGNELSATKPIVVLDDKSVIKVGGTTLYFRSAIMEEV